MGVTAQSSTIAFDSTNGYIYRENSGKYCKFDLYGNKIYEKLLDFYPEAIVCDPQGALFGYSDYYVARIPTDSSTELIWKRTEYYDSDFTIIYGGITCDKTFVYVAGGDNAYIAFDKETGDTIWHIETDYQKLFAAPFVISNPCGLIIGFTNQDYDLKYQARDKENGEFICEFPYAYSGRASMCVGEDGYAYYWNDEEIYKFSMEDASELKYIDMANIFDPYSQIFDVMVSNDSKLYVTMDRSDGNYLVKVDMKGTLYWKELYDDEHSCYLFFRK